MNEKPVIVFVFEKRMGGVAYMNIEIINHSRIREFFRVRVILILPVTTQREDELMDTDINADEIFVYKVDSFRNRHFLLKGLHDLIGNEPGVIVCNDNIELDCIAMFGTNKTVYQIVHDFYSIRMFLAKSNNVDVFLTHSKFWKDVMYSTGAIDDIYKHIRHGIQLLDYSQKKQPSAILKIAFTGRLIKTKGVLLLWEIEQELRSRNIQVEWTIIGGGPLKDDLKDQWKNATNVKFISPVKHSDVLDEMMKCDLFVFPSEFEGYGIAILEALSCGLVPVVSDVAGGTGEILSDIGFRVPYKDVKAYADKVEELNNDRDKLIDLQSKCRRLAEKEYDIKITSNNYLDVFLNYKNAVRIKKKLPKVKSGSLLDKPFFPDTVTKFLRKMRHQ